MDLRILFYEDVLKELEYLKNNYPFKKMDAPKTFYGIDIPYYTLGSGPNHLVVVGGTHGSEIISVDFVLRLMMGIACKSDPFNTLNLDDYTFHFIPVHNPEGYIISSSVINTLINSKSSSKDIESIARAYYLNYMLDDLKAINYPNDKKQKLHQKFFADATYKCISEKYHDLRENVKKIYDNEAIPKGSMVIHRGNGLGIETNRTNLFYTLNKDCDCYGPLRYNNILNNMEGPLGSIPKEDIIENIFLKNLLNKLYKEKLYCGFITYHSAGGEVYAYLSDDDELLCDQSLIDYEQKYRFNVINHLLAKNYQENTKSELIKDGYQIQNSGSIKDYDEYLRLLYPATLLIELSPLLGNPLGPYALQSNYEDTINSNLKAFSNYAKLVKQYKSLMYKSEYVFDAEVSKRMLKNRY